MLLQRPLQGVRQLWHYLLTYWCLDHVRGATSVQASAACCARLCGVFGWFDSARSLKLHHCAIPLARGKLHVVVLARHL
jgi:hypothetical protein